MNDFVHQKNLEHYRKLLAGDLDDAQRKMLLKLLAEEQAKEPPSPAGGRPRDEINE
jgi:hypothetical protein